MLSYFLPTLTIRKKFLRLDYVSLSSINIATYLRYIYVDQIKFFLVFDKNIINSPTAQEKMSL